MPEPKFPGDLSELDFVAAYSRSTLRKPQLAADAALRALVFADTSDRVVLVGLIAGELSEACRRLVAVYRALADRRVNVARSLLAPLPGLVEWREFAHEAGTFSPEQIVRELGLGEEAMRHAESLRGQPSLADLGELVAAAETGNPMFLVPTFGRADEAWVAGIDREGRTVATSFAAASEPDAIGLADLTADLCGIARGFLESYLQGRRSAGRRDD